MDNDNIKPMSWNSINNQINHSAYDRVTTVFNSNNDHIPVFSKKVPTQCEKISTSELHTIYLSHGNQTSEHGAHLYNVSVDSDIRKPELTRYHRQDGVDMIKRLNLPTKYHIPDPLKRPEMTRNDKEYI